MTKLLTRIQLEVVAVAGAIVAGGEGVLTALPAGPVHNVAAILLPILAGVVARARVMPVGRVQQLLDALKAAAAGKPAAGK